MVDLPNGGLGFLNRIYSFQYGPASDKHQLYEEFLRQRERNSKPIITSYAQQSGNSVWKSPVKRISAQTLFEDKFSTADHNFSSKSHLRNKIYDLLYTLVSIGCRSYWLRFQMVFLSFQDFSPIYI